MYQGGVPANLGNIPKNNFFTASHCIFQKFIRKTFQRRTPEWWGQSSRTSCNQRVEGTTRMNHIVSRNSKANVFWHDIQLIFKQVKSRSVGFFLIKDIAFRHLTLKDQEDFCFVTPIQMATLLFIFEKSRDKIQEVNWDVKNKKIHSHLWEKSPQLADGFPKHPGVLMPVQGEVERCPCNFQYKWYEWI